MKRRFVSNSYMPFFRLVNIVIVTCVINTKTKKCLKNKKKYKNFHNYKKITKFKRNSKDLIKNVKLLEKVYLRIPCNL